MPRYATWLGTFVCCEIIVLQGIDPSRKELILIPLQ